MTFIRDLESRADGSLCFGVIQWSSVQRRFKSNERTNTCVFLHHFQSLLLYNVQLYIVYIHYVQCLHVIGQTTLDVLGNIKILAHINGTYGHPTNSFNAFWSCCKTLFSESIGIWQYSATCLIKSSVMAGLLNNFTWWNACRIVPECSSKPANFRSAPKT